MEQQDRVLISSGPRRVSPFLIPAMIAVSPLNGPRASVAICGSVITAELQQQLGPKGPSARQMKGATKPLDRHMECVRPYGRAPPRVGIEPLVWLLQCPLLLLCCCDFCRIQPLLR